jgi:hypothetical protein
MNIENEELYKSLLDLHHLNRKNTILIENFVDLVDYKIRSTYSVQILKTSNMSILPKTTKHVTYELTYFTSQVDTLSVLPLSV